MKYPRFVSLMIIGTIAMLSLSPVAAAPSMSHTRAPVQQQEPLPPCPICDSDTIVAGSSVLTQQEVEGLLLALNDEYHAWAVYDQVIQDFGNVRPFVNIRRSEESHIRALERMMNLYGVPIPANPWPGHVAGYASVTEACAAGGQAEIEDRDLYDTILQTTERPNILTVYRALARASAERHLPAFERCSARGNRPAR